MSGKEGLQTKSKEYKSLEELEDDFGNGEITREEFGSQRNELWLSGKILPKPDAPREKLTPEFEKIREVLQTQIEKLVVHGEYPDKEWPKEWSDVKLKADLDAMAGIYLMDLAGINYKKLEFVEKGGVVPGAFHIDTGPYEKPTVLPDGSIFFSDHGEKKPQQATSAAQMIYEMLTKTGFLQREEWLDRFTKFVTEIDNLNYPIDEEFFRKKWSHTLYGTWKVLPVNVVADLFKSGKVKDPREPFSMELASSIVVSESGGKKKTLMDVCNKTGQLAGMSIDHIRRTPEKMKERGIKMDHPELGKVIVNIIERGKKSKIRLGFDAIRALGYDTYVMWNDNTKSFFISNQSGQLEKIYEKIKNKIPEAKLIRGVMLLVSPGEGVKNLTSEEFLSLLGLKEYSKTTMPDKDKEKIKPAEPADEEIVEDAEGRWRKVKDGEAFEPGHEFRIDPNKGKWVKIGEPPKSVQPSGEGVKDAISEYIENTLGVKFGEGTMDRDEFIAKRNALEKIKSAPDIQEALDEIFGEGIIEREEYLELRSLFEKEPKVKPASGSQHKEYKSFEELEEAFGQGDIMRDEFIKRREDFIKQEGSVAPQSNGKPVKAEEEKEKSWQERIVGVFDSLGGAWNKLWTKFRGKEGGAEKMNFLKIFQEAAEKVQKRFEGIKQPPLEDLARAFIEEFPERYFPGLAEIKREPERLNKMIKDLADAFREEDKEKRSKKIDEWFNAYYPEGIVRGGLKKLTKKYAEWELMWGQYRRELTPEEKEKAKKELEAMKKEAMGFKEWMVAGGFIGGAVLLAGFIAFIICLAIMEKMMNIKPPKK